MSQLESAIQSQPQAWIEALVSAKKYRQVLGEKFFSPRKFDRIVFVGLGSSRTAAELCVVTLRSAAVASRPGAVAVRSASASAVRSGAAIARSATVMPRSVSAPTRFVVGQENFLDDLTRNDLVVAISHRGKTEWLLKRVKSARKMGCEVLQVSARGTRAWFAFDRKNSEASLSGVRLIEVGELERVEPHTVSLTSAVALVTALFEPGLEKAWKGQIKKVSGFLTESVPAGAGLAARSDSQKIIRPRFILGDGVGEVLAREAQLKAVEVAKVTALAFSSEAFFHGPHWGYVPGDGIVYFSVSGDDRSKKIRGLSAGGAGKVAPGLGPTGAPSNNQSVFEIELARGPLGWVLALAKLQRLAVDLARQSGVHPDWIR